VTELENFIFRLLLCVCVIQGFTAQWQGLFHSRFMEDAHFCILSIAMGLSYVIREAKTKK